MTSHHQEDRQIAAQATQWIDELENGSASGEAFFVWLKESPKHIQQVLAMSAVARSLANLSPSTRSEIQQRLEIARAMIPKKVVPLDSNPTVAQPPWRSRQPLRFYATAIAASVIAAVVIGIWLVATRSEGQIYTTKVGEQRTVELDDGSIMHLNTQSQLSVRMAPRSRDVHLLEGEALFDVKHDTVRPFRVHTPDAVIEALGTQFNVYHRPAGTQVSVIEGAVQVSGEPRAIRAAESSSGAIASLTSTQLAAGEEAHVSPSGHIDSREPVNLGRATAWRQRRLIFHSDTLDDIAVEFNRYNRRVSIQVQSEVGSRRFSGTFDADAPESLARVLAIEPTLKVEVHSDHIVIRNGL